MAIQSSKALAIMSPFAPEQSKSVPIWQKIREWVGRHRVELLLFILLWSTYSYFYQATGDNEACRLDQLRALVADHTLKIDKYWWNTADVIHYPPGAGAAVYPNKAPGTTLLLAPAYAVVVALLSPLRDLGVPEWLYWHLLIYLLTIFTISLFCALAGVLMYRILLQLTGSRSASVGAVTAIWLGTLVFPYATLFFSHALTAALVVFAFYLLFQLRQCDGSLSLAKLGRAGAAGLFLSFSVVTEYPAAMVAGVMSIYALWIGWQWRVPLRTKLIYAATFGIGALIGAGFLVGYNCVAFGKPFYIPYESYAHTGASFSSTYTRGWLGMNWSGAGHFLKALGAIILFPPIGLLYLKLQHWWIYACNPVLWLSIPGIFIVLRNRMTRPEGLLVVGLTVAYLLFLTSYGSSIYDWAGASYLGPRHLVPLLPFLAIPIAFAWPRVSWLFFPLLGLSIFYMLLGTAVEPRVPFPFEIPARDLLLPDYLHGKLAQNAHHLFDSGEHLLTRDSTAFNLAKLAGVPGRMQLLPLMIWWALIGAALIRTAHDRGEMEARELVTPKSSTTVSLVILLLFTCAVGFTPTIHHAVAGPKATGRGLLGKYYRNAKWSGVPVDVQVDPVIDFDWSKSTPLPPPFSIEWTGKLLVEQPGEYVFSLIADDGAMLEIDGRQVISGEPAFLQEKSGNLELKAGLHPIRVRYFNTLFGGSIRLWWELTSRPKQIIPSEALVPATPNDEKETSAK